MGTHRRWERVVRCVWHHRLGLESTLRRRALADGPVSRSWIARFGRAATGEPVAHRSPGTTAREEGRPGATRHMASHPVGLRIPAQRATKMDLREPGSVVGRPLAARRTARARCKEVPYADRARCEIVVGVRLAWCPDLPVRGARPGPAGDGHLHPGDGLRRVRRGDGHARHRGRAAGEAARADAVVAVPLGYRRRPRWPDGIRGTRPHGDLAALPHRGMVARHRCPRDHRCRPAPEGDPG